MLVLRIQRVRSRESVTDLPDGVTRVGRDRASNDLVVDASGISRHHAILSVAGGVVEIVDAGSKNGTFFRRRRRRSRGPKAADTWFRLQRGTGEESTAYKAKLHAGDEFRLGTVEIKIDERSEASGDELKPPGRAAAPPAPGPTLERSRAPRSKKK